MKRASQPSPPSITPVLIIAVIIIVTSVSSSSDAPIMTIISFCPINRHNDT